MYGRFVRFSTVERFADLCRAQGLVEAKASYSIAPSTHVLFDRNSSEGQRELAMVK